MQKKKVPIVCVCCVLWMFYVCFSNINSLLYTKAAGVIYLQAGHMHAHVFHIPERSTT